MEKNGLKMNKIKLSESIEVSKKDLLILHLEKNAKDCLKHDLKYNIKNILHAVSNVGISSLKELKDILYKYDLICTKEKEIKKFLINKSQSLQILLKKKKKNE